MLLRFTFEEVEDTWPKDQDTVLQPDQPGRKLITPGTLSPDSQKLWRSMRTF